MDYSLEVAKQKEILLRSIYNLHAKSEDMLQKTRPLLRFQRGIGMVTKQHVHQLTQTIADMCHSLDNIENLLFFRQNNLVQTIQNFGECQSEGITGIHCSPSGTIYTTSSSSPWVRILNSSGQIHSSLLCTEWGKAKQYFFPEDVTLTGAGLVAVTDLVNGVVRIFNPYAKFSMGEWLNIGKMVSPRGIGVNPFGQLLVADYVPGKIHVFAVNRALKLLHSHAISGLSGPRYVCTDPDGNIIVSEEYTDVKVFGKDNNMIYSLTTKYRHHFGNPAGVCADLHGNILVADEQNKQVFLFPKQGSPVCLVSKGLQKPTGVACSPYGLLLVVDAGECCIKVYKYKVMPYYHHLKGTSMTGVSKNGN